MSQSGAEIRLAAYEALACVLKALSTYFNPSCLDFVMAYNESHFSNDEVKPLLDPLVLCFLHNINDLLANGVLARSRRAVLMNWKVKMFYNSLFCWSPFKSLFCLDLAQSFRKACARRYMETNMLLILLVALSRFPAVRSLHSHWKRSSSKGCISLVFSFNSPKYFFWCCWEVMNPLCCLKYFCKLLFLCVNYQI